LSRYRDRRALHSFPTRRSSDLVPPEQVLEVARREGAIPYDVTGAELGHHQGKCSFEAIVTKYKIDDPAVRLLAQIVHGADVAQRSEEHTSELQSRGHLVCRLLL